MRACVRDCYDGRETGEGAGSSAGTDCRGSKYLLLSARQLQEPGRSARAVNGCGVLDAVEI